MRVVDSGVRLDRVVAVLATLRDGREQIGSGYLVNAQLVVTAAHCARDKVTREAPTQLRVIRANDGKTVDVDLTGVVVDDGLDVAVLPLAGLPWDADLPVLTFGRVDRSQSGVLEDCAGIGFPLFQRDAEGNRDTSEFHGVIYQTDEAQSGRLLMREPLIHPSPMSTSGDARSVNEADLGPSPWGGLSGATAFYKGQAIGVVVEHHPRQGDSAIRLIGFDRVARNVEFRQILGLPEAERLPLVAAEPEVWLAELLELWEDDDLPRVADLDPYRLGATVSDYGDRTNHGEHDPYVQRISHDVDLRLREALQPSRLVVLVGPSKSGKTRTAFEAIKDRWPQARLLAPNPTALPTLATHPRIALTSDVLVLWLDDLQRFLTTAHPLTSALLARLTARRGRLIVIATLRTEERARLRNVGGELARDTRLLFDEAGDSTIELAGTSENPDEQAAAGAAYPHADLSTAGLAEQLAGAPALLQQYRDARYHDPILHQVLQTAIDWARVGMARPVSADELITLVRDALLRERPELEPSEEQMLAAIVVARTPPPSAGRVAGLRTVVQPDGTRGYRPFDYLVAADDGQVGIPRVIPRILWNSTLELAEPDEASAIGVSAYERDNIPVALLASQQAAIGGSTEGMRYLGLMLADLDPPDLDAARDWLEQAASAGNTDAMVNLGVLLSELDPPDLDGARSWYEQAAAAGNTAAMNNLGNLFVSRIDPPELDTARRWYDHAIAGGNAGAMARLGYLLSRLDPPDLDGARRWYEQAAAAGDIDAMVNLGVLLSELDPPDLDGARRWYEQAAAAGDTDAMRNVGVLLADLLDPPDLDEARHWWERAAAAGNTAAMVNLAYLLADRLDRPELDQARGWYKRAATDGHIEAMVNLGVLLAMRMDPPDLDEARRWYEQAAAIGNTIVGDTGAMVNLAYLLSNLLDVPDINQARRWLERAAERGDTVAMVNLGILLATRLDPPDLGQARRWWEHAADRGNTDAMVNLGVLLATELDPPDLGQARRLWERAAAAGNTTAISKLGLLGIHPADQPDTPDRTRSATLRSSPPPRWRPRSPHP